MTEVVTTSTESVPTSAREGRGKAAARWLAEQSGDLGKKEAAARFGITREAVRQAWQQLGLGETPRQKLWRQLRPAVVELGRAGKPLRQIITETGVTAHLVRRWCREEGVAVRRGYRAADPAAVSAGLDVVRNGGSIAEGAAAAGIQYAAFHRYVKRAQLRSNPCDPRKRFQGRSAQAALLVTRDRLSPNEAARLLEISPTSVIAYLKRYSP